MSQKKTIFVSFYAGENGTGGVFRETLVSHHFNQTHGWLVRMCERKAKLLGAKSFVMYEAIPRIFNAGSADTL